MLYMYQLLYYPFIFFQAFENFKCEFTFWLKNRVKAVDSTDNIFNMNGMQLKTLKF